MEAEGKGEVGGDGVGVGEDEEGCGGGVVAGRIFGTKAMLGGRDVEPLTRSRLWRLRFLSSARLYAYELAELEFMEWTLEFAAARD